MQDSSTPSILFYTSPDPSLRRIRVLFLLWNRQVSRLLPPLEAIAIENARYIDIPIPPINYIIYMQLHGWVRSNKILQGTEDTRERIKRSNFATDILFLLPMAAKKHMKFLWLPRNFRYILQENANQFVNACPNTYSDWITMGVGVEHSSGQYLEPSDDVTQGPRSRSGDLSKPTQSVRSGWGSCPGTPRTLDVNEGYPLDNSRPSTPVDSYTFQDDYHGTLSSPGNGQQYRCAAPKRSTSPWRSNVFCFIKIAFLLQSSLFLLDRSIRKRIGSMGIWAELHVADQILTNSLSEPLASSRTLNAYIGRAIHWYLTLCFVIVSCSVLLEILRIAVHILFRSLVLFSCFSIVSLLCV